jgi:hypothetical protein
VRSVIIRGIRVFSGRRISKLNLRTFLGIFLYMKMEIRTKKIESALTAKNDSKRTKNSIKSIRTTSKKADEGPKTFDQRKPVIGYNF